MRKERRKRRRERYMNETMKGVREGGEIE